jgi:hypothetical protein
MEFFKKKYVGVIFVNGINEREYYFRNKLDCTIGDTLLVNTKHGYQQAVVTSIHENNPHNKPVTHTVLDFVEKGRSHV